MGPSCLLPPSLPAREAFHQLDTPSGPESTQPEHQMMFLGSAGQPSIPLPPASSAQSWSSFDGLPRVRRCLAPPLSFYRWGT